ncbi:MAG: acyltransferase [Bradyrhizobium sp.]|nr:acyltransferase [Bradyrhizobium sp.]
MARDSLRLIPDQVSQGVALRRDVGIDTMRGAAILMVIGIHSLQQPLNSWQTLADAPLRPCVPIFLFASGYLTALSGRVPLWKRLKAVLTPYAIAFVAAYIYMTLRNPAMDHHFAKTLARFVFAYVFVYYYVFVYVGCTIALWLLFSASAPGTQQSERRLTIFLLLSIALGLIVGSYLDPLLSRFGLSDHLIEEVRMRDIPFWFSFMALGTLLGIYGRRSSLHDTRALLSGATLFACLFYATVRLFGLGDAADYDSVAFFGYAALLCILLFTFDVQSPSLAALGSGSYFIYLWHIFIVMALRDHAGLTQLGLVANFAVTFTVAAFGSILALLIVRAIAPPYLLRWLGA